MRPRADVRRKGTRTKTGKKAVRPRVAFTNTGRKELLLVLPLYLFTCLLRPYFGGNLRRGGALCTFHLFSFYSAGLQVFEKKKKEPKPDPQEQSAAAQTDNVGSQNH